MKNCLLLAWAFALLAKANAQADSTTAPVPLTTLSFFAVQPVERLIQLKWSLSHTDDYKSIDIERSDDGVNFVKIGSKLAISKGIYADYEFVDATPKRNALLRYRLKLLFKDGLVTYSDLREIKTTDISLTVRLKQNPVRNTLPLEIAAATGQAFVTIVSQGGQQMTTQTLRLPAGTNQLSVSTQSLLPGLYQLVVEAGAERKTISFIKE